MTADPTDVYATAIRAAAGNDAMIALVHATAFSDDRQVMVHLERRPARTGTAHEHDRA